MLDSAVLELLAKVVGGENILTDAYDLDRYSADALNPFRAFGAEEAFDRLADAVVRPSCAGEVAEVVRLASLEGIPVVPHGGGTGVMGGVLPVRGGIVLDLKRINRILSINPTDLTATVEPGVVLKDLVDALAEHGLMPGHDPYSVPIATVAGTISTNGVGYRAAAFGPMGSQVVALEVVLPDGRTMSTRPVPKYSSGPNLNHLFIGSEGVFGVITQATIQVFRLPEARTFSAVDFDSFDTGFQGAAEILALGIRPTLLDLSDDEEGIRLHLLFEGFKEGVAAQHQRSLEVADRHGRQAGRPGTHQGLLAGPAPVGIQLQTHLAGQTPEGPVAAVGWSQHGLPAHGPADIQGPGIPAPLRGDHGRHRSAGYRVCHLEPARVVFDAGDPFSRRGR